MLIKSAVDLINPNINPEGHTNYQFVAGRLKNSVLRKKVYGRYEPYRLFDIVKNNINEGVYTKELMEWYTEEDWDRMETFIDHSKDELYAYSAIDQLTEKYLVKNKVTGQIYETPQIRYIVAAATQFHKEKDFKKIKKYYKSASNGHFTLATPVLARTRHSN